MPLKVLICILTLSTITSKMHFEVMPLFCSSAISRAQIRTARLVDAAIRKYCTEKVMSLAFHGVLMRNVPPSLMAIFLV